MLMCHVMDFYIWSPEHLCGPHPTHLRCDAVRLKEILLRSLGEHTFVLCSCGVFCLHSGPEALLLLLGSCSSSAETGFRLTTVWLFICISRGSVPVHTCVCV